MDACELLPCRCRTFLSLAVVLVVAALPASSAAAASSWVVPSEHVVSSIPLSVPAVAMSESGESTELWTEPSEGEASSTLASSTRPAGGVWTAPATVPSRLHVHDPAVAVTPDDRVTGVWVDNEEGNGNQTWSSERAGEGAWGPAVRLGAVLAQRFAYSPSVAVNASDGAAAVWYVYDEAKGEEWIEAASREGSIWAAPVRLSTPGSAVQRYGRVDVVADGHGGFVTLWVQYDELSGLYSVVAEELSEGSWQGAQTIVSSYERLEDPSIAENASGEATAVWLNYELRELESASLRQGQWTPQLIDGSSENSFCGLPQPQVGVDAAGVSTAAWVTAAGDVFADTLPSGGVWSGASRLTSLPEGTIAREPTLVENPAGTAALAWNLWNTSANEWSSEASYRPADGSWEAPTNLSTAVTQAVTPPSLAIDAAGDALASWGAGEYGPASDLFYAYVQAPPSPASTPTGTSVTSGGGSSPSASPTSTPAVPKLGPVYLVVAHSRLRLHRHSHVVSAVIRNLNPFPVTGTATMRYFLFKRREAHTASGSRASALATVAHFALASHARGRVSFRLSARALRRLFADVPDSGHDLVSIRLVINGPDGQRSSGSSVYALDAPPAARARHRRVPVVPPGYRAPVDPWVQAHAAC